MIGNKPENFSVRKRLKSFKYAFNGLKILIQDEHNARIHFIAAIIVVILGFLLKISMVEWLAIVFAIGFVITCEIINSAIENLADYVSPEKNEIIKKVKDLSAAAVLFSAITAIVIGILVFLPKLIVYV
jgi:diacylglycerol kinase